MTAQHARKHDRRGARHHALTLLALGSCLAHPLGAQVRREFRELHMGMEVRIVVYARGDEHAQASARAAFHRIAALEDIMSDYRPESELRRLERQPGRKVRVSADLFDVLSTAISVAGHTQGAFDPTVAPLVTVWREARRSGRLPDQGTLDSARALVSWRRVLLDAGTRQVELEPGTRLDLGGVAKGYIVERALVTLRERGVTSALIEAGGDVGVSDAPPGEQGWQVAAPFGDSSVQSRASALANAFIATSGPGAQYLDVDGRRYSHVVDPRSGRALESPAHATVIASSGALADALATALTLVQREQRAPLMQIFEGVTAWSVRP